MGKKKESEYQYKNDLNLLELVIGTSLKESLDKTLDRLHYSQEISRLDTHSSQEDKNLYTLHGLHHIKTVIKNISDLIIEADFLSDDDRELLTMSVLYHDIGMKTDRFNHAEESVKILKQQNTLSDYDDGKKNIIYDTIKSHTLSKIKAEENINKHNDNGDKIEKLICLLRIGDILDCAIGRLDEIEVKDIPFSSYLHWKKHKLISNVKFNKNEKKAIIHTSESLKHNWEYEFIETEFSYIKEEFDFAHKRIKEEFSENCIHNVDLSSQFYINKNQLIEQQKKKNIDFMPYSRIEDSSYYSLFGRKQVTFDIIHSIFSCHKSTIIYGQKGVGKSSLLKCKICNILESLKSDEISYKYIEDYENINELFKGTTSQQIIIFDQFEKVLLNDNKKEMFFTEIEKIKENDNVRFLFSIPTDKLKSIISLDIIQDNTPKILIERLSIDDVMDYVSILMATDETQTNKIKDIISFLKANPIDNIKFNNRLNILFSYIKKEKSGKIPSLNDIIEEDMLNESITKYHDDLFKDNTKEQNLILNKFVTRNNRIITLSPQNDTEKQIFKALENKSILRNIDDSANGRYEFIHTQLLNIYRQDYCTDKGLKDKMNLEEELERAYIEKKDGINTDSLQKIPKYDVNNILFKNEDDDKLKGNLHKFIIKQLLISNNVTKLIIENYDFDANKFSEILWDLLFEVNKNEIYNAYIKYRNLFKRFFPVERPENTNSLSIQEIQQYTFLEKLEDNKISESIFDSSSSDTNLYYLTDELRNEIIELVYFNYIRTEILNSKTNDNSVKEYRDYIKDKQNGSNIFQSICKSFNFEKANHHILTYFQQFYINECEQETGQIVVNTGDVCFRNASGNQTDLQLSSEQKLVVLSGFYNKRDVKCYKKDNKIIALTSDKRTIKYYTKRDIFNFLLNIKLSRDKNVPSFSKSNIFNAEWSVSLNSIITKINAIKKNKESNIPIKLSKVSDSNDLFEITEDNDNDVTIYYHKSFSPEDVTAKINSIKNNNIKANENDSSLLVIIIGKEDKIFEEKYKNIVSFYVYFDDRIALVSQAIDAWCYEVMKIKRILDENKNIRKIFIVPPENYLPEENASKFLLAEHKDSLIETDENYKELKIYNSESWNELFKDITIETATKDNFDEKLYKFFCFEQDNYIQPIISKATKNDIDVPTYINGLNNSGDCDREKNIISNTFSEAYINTIKKIDKCGIEAGDTKEIIGLTIQINNPIEALNKLLSDKSFYRYNEIEDYYQKQWLQSNGRIFQYIDNKFGGVNQLEMVNSLIYNSIINDQSTRKGAFTFYFPDLNKLDKIDSLFSCFVIIRKENAMTYDLNPYFIWRSNECVFGILLSLINSIRWFNEKVYEALKKQLPQNNFKMTKYYYHGINMHIENNYLINSMINKIFNELENKNI